MCQRRYGATYLCFQHLKLFQAGIVLRVWLIVSAEPGIKDLANHTLRDTPQRQAEHIGVIPQTSPASSSCIFTQCGSYPRYFVGSDTDAGTGPAEEDALINSTTRYRFSYILSNSRLGTLFSCQCAIQPQRMTRILQSLNHLICKVRAFIRPDRQPHESSLFHSRLP
jgi:hypothetical protein